MKKADIYFNGEIIKSIGFFKSKFITDDNTVGLFSEEEKLIAIIPKEYLIVFVE